MDLPEQKTLSAMHMSCGRSRFYEGHRYIKVISDREGRALDLTDDRWVYKSSVYPRARSIRKSGENRADKGGE